ncbi:MAG: hypothetical protein A3G41_00910 [Elusimicrobia bacterium RIFCSPLOWO2_12_FULL_59_9]|nr:MAG: hypothetical protein A3G41_00910 [Elusimicrobia bacterium RIFCSPLOWO2_12_FULL_59_9]
MRAFAVSALLFSMVSGFSAVEAATVGRLAQMGQVDTQGTPESLRSRGTEGWDSSPVQTAVAWNWRRGVDPDHYGWGRQEISENPSYKINRKGPNGKFEVNGPNKPTVEKYMEKESRAGKFMLLGFIFTILAGAAIMMTNGGVGLLALAPGGAFFLAGVALYYAAEAYRKKNKINVYDASGVEIHG